MEIKYTNQEVIHCNHQYDDKYTTIVFDNLVNAKLLLQFPKAVPSLENPQKLITETSVPIVDNKWTISQSYLKHSGIIYAQIVENIEGQYVKHGDIFKLIVDKSLGNGEPIEDIPFQFKSKFDEMVKVINDVQTKLNSGEFNGKSAYELAVENGFKGTEKEWLESLDYERSQEFTDLANQVRTDSQQVIKDKTHVDKTVKEFNISVTQAQINIDAKVNEVNANALQVSQDKAQVSQDALQVSQDKIHVDTVVKEFDTVTTQANKNFTDKVSQANNLFDTKVLSANQGIDTKVSEFDTKVSEANTTIDAKVKQANTEIDTKVKQAGDSAVQAQASADSIKASSQKIDKNASEITQLKQDLTKLIIEDKASGNPCVISDSTDWQMQGLNIYGQSEQNGTPTPDAPVPIVNKEVTNITVVGDNRQKQDVKLSKPITLRGIPVSNNGNVTINGKQYISDEINSNYEHVTKIKPIIFDGTETWYTWGANINGNIGFYFYPNTITTSQNIEGNHCISNYLPYSSSAYNGNEIGVNVIKGKNPTLTYIVVSLKQSELGDVSSKELAIKSFKEFLTNKKESGVPFEIYCQLLESIIKPLSEADQQAIKSLKTYHHNTTINSGAWNEATYIADPKLFIEKQHQGIQSQIHELQSNLITAKISGGGSNNAIVINDSSNMKIKSIKMYGQSSQVKTTGVNLINGMDTLFLRNASNSNLANYCWEYSLGGNPLVLEKPLKAGVTYTYSFYADKMATIYFSKSPYVSGNFESFSINRKVDGDIMHGLQRYFGTFVLKGEKDIVGIYSEYNKCFGGMINEGSKPLPYEPYSRGKPSPSPDYPQKITPKEISEIRISGNDSQKQLITLSQPISLHGIPASSDSNISIDGKQYISDVLCEKDGNIGIERNCGYIEHYIDENVGDTYISTTGELSNGASVLYKLEVSTFESLPLIDQTKIRNITSYYPTTNIHIDAYSEVEYIADTKTYIDNKIAGVSTALIKGV